MNKIKLATVFSGIGAVEQAMKRLNIDHELVFACDSGEIEIEYNHEDEFKKVKSLGSINDKKKYVDDLYASKTKKKNYVQQSYMHNYPQLDGNRFFQDIKLLDGTDFKGNVDLLVGGSPCQTFSSVGFKKGLEDARGTLFYEYARLIKEVEPKVFIYENVRGLINHDKGNTWEVMKGIFNSLGYTISFDVLNACDFGIPQNRRRLFVIGTKNETKFNFETLNKTSLKYTMHNFLQTNCAFGNFMSKDNGTLTLDMIGEKIDNLYILSEKIYAYVMSGGTKNFYQKPEINKTIARTILKTMGNRHRAGVDNYVSYDMSNDFGKVRMLTEREAHRLMGFPDDYEIIVSRAQAYKQAGNSIVVDVMMEILSGIISMNDL